MVTESMMYWITRLDGINGAITAILAVSIIITFIAAIVFFSACIETAYEEEIEEMWHSKFAKNTRRWLFTLLATSVLALVFVPTTKEMAMIYAVPAITRSDFVREDLPELYDYGIDALKEQLKEWSQPETKGE